MNYFSENLRILIWKNKKEFPHQSYKEYISFVAQKCDIAYYHLINIVRGIKEPTLHDEKALIDFFEDEEEITSIKYKRLNQELIDKSQNELLENNIQYLLSLLSWGENSTFVQKVGINASTLTRWKQGKTKPDKNAQVEIAKYFGIENPEFLKNHFYFLDIEPVSVQQKKDELKKIIDSMDDEDVNALARILKYKVAI